MDSPVRSQARTRAVPLFLTLIFLASEGVLLANAAVYFVNTRQAIARSDTAARQVEVTGRIAAIRTLLGEAESAARGYALTGEERFLNAHAAAAREVRPALDRLDAMLSAAPGQRTDFVRLEALADAQLAAMERLLAARREGGPAAASEALRTSETPGVVLSTQGTLADLGQREEAEREQRRGQARRASHATSASAIAVSLLAMLVIALFYRRMRSYLVARHDAEAELQQTNDSLNLLVAERTAELTHLSQHLISVAEEEKAVFARELHDALGSNLTAVDIDVKWVERKLRADSPELADRLRRALVVLEQSVDIKRSIIEALRPSLLDMLGLATALESLCEEFTRRTGIDCIPDLEQELPELPPDVSIALYRVVQEALANAGKHAQARVVRVALHRESEHLHLVVEDDGVGIPADAITRPHSHGLVGMRERLRVLGGTFEIRRGAGGRGTVLDAIAPRPV